LSDWFHVPSWERTEFPGDAHSASTLKGSNWLIIADESPLAARFRDILKQLGAVTTVAWFGPAYARRSDSVHVIRAAEAGDYVRLLSAMSAPDLPSLHVVHLGALSSRAAPLAGAGHAQTQDRGFYSLLELAKAFGELSLAMPVTLGVVTCQLHEVTGNETLDPTMAPVLGACGVIPREYPNVTGFSVDLPAIPPGDGELDARLRQLIAEFAAPANGATLAYRGRFRWEKRFKAQPLPALPSDRDASLRAQGLRPRGVYLITGGTGGIGLTIAKYLAETCQARLVLTKRTPLPEKRFWRERLAAAGIHDDERRILAALVEIESLGGEVEVRVCEAADEAGMRQVVADTVARHGGLHGVIHAAGVIGLGLIQVKTRAAVENVFAPKVAGTLALHHALQGVGLDFIVFISSLVSVTMPYALADYCAAHAFLDAFARYREARDSGRVLTINWPIWNEVGILANMQAQAGAESRKDAAREQGISTRDGVEVLRRALGARISQLIVSHQDLGEAVRQAAMPSTEAARDRAAGAAGSKQRQAVKDLPQTELDQGVAAIWSEVLGIAPIGLHEKFFDLGGHSLLAMQIVSRLRTAYQVNFTLKNFFESPTIAEIGHAVQERLVSEIEGLSDAEVTRRVAGD
jgi:NAD(P)-dependent dehydrogenase (short-subunit alcohol dehydrogenase family)/acyl carrier protein